MKVTLLPSKLNGTLTAPPSKSYMHRALICASAADNPTKIFCSAFSKDTKATISCLKALGAKFEFSDEYVRVFPIEEKEHGEQCVLDCGESGSTLRFMLPFAAALGKKCTFVGAKRLGERPIKPLVKVLEENGVKISFQENSFLPCDIEGKLKSAIFKIPGDISSQFVTGLLLALGVMGGGEIEVTGALKSAPYIDITTSVQKKFGIDIIKTEKGYKAEKAERYISPMETEIEGDYSNAAFWLVAGAIGSEEKITCNGLFEKSLQGDRKIVDALKAMGADIKRERDGITVYRSSLKGIELDCADIPDIVPILCVAACAAEGKSVFRNIERLREKESDRVKTTLDMISSLGGKAESDETTITIEKSFLKGGIVTSANDHRIAMSAAIASLICEKEVTVDIAEAVAKSYPDFYEKFEMLGGGIK